MAYWPSDKQRAERHSDQWLKLIKKSGNKIERRKRQELLRTWNWRKKERQRHVLSQSWGVVKRGAAVKMVPRSSAAMPRCHRKYGGNFHDDSSLGSIGRRCRSVAITISLFQTVLAVALFAMLLQSTSTTTTSTTTTSMQFMHAVFSCFAAFRNVIDLLSVVWRMGYPTLAEWTW